MKNSFKSEKFFRSVFRTIIGLCLIILTFFIMWVAYWTISTLLSAFIVATIAVAIAGVGTYLLCPIVWIALYGAIIYPDDKKVIIKKILRLKEKYLW